jgi:hypothetical protein
MSALASIHPVATAIAALPKTPVALARIAQTRKPTTTTAEIAELFVSEDTLA